jgi:hypothetical protein
MASTEFYKVRERVQDAVYGGSAVLRGTADSGDADTLVDAGVALSGATADHYDYGWVKIRSTTDGAAPQGEVRAIDEGGFTASTGSFETTAFSAVIDAGDTFEIWPQRPGVSHPSDVDSAINRKLRELHMPAIFPLTCHLLAGDDNDMEASGVAAFTDSSATSSKNAGGFNGAQSLLVTASGANGYSTTSLLAVFEGKQYISSVMVSAAAGDSGRFRMTDATNSNATIEDSAAITQVQWTEAMFQWSPPDGCLAVQPRFMAIGSNDLVLFDDYQTWYADGGHYPLPSWITRKEQVIKVVRYPQGTGAPDGEATYQSDESRGIEVPYRFERADTRATNELQIYVGGVGLSRPYIVAYKPLSEVTADYVTTTANTIPLSSTETDALVAGVLADIHRTAARVTTGQTQEEHKAEARRLEAEYKDGLNHLRPEWRTTTRQHDRVWGVVA